MKVSPRDVRLQEDEKSDCVHRAWFSNSTEMTNHAAVIDCNTWQGTMTDQHVTYVIQANSGHKQMHRTSTALRARRLIICLCFDSYDGLPCVRFAHTCAHQTFLVWACQECFPLAHHEHRPPRYALIRRLMPSFDLPQAIGHPVAWFVSVEGWLEWS